MATRKTVLIFGVSSFIGSNLAEYLKDHFRVIGTYNGYKTRIKGVLTYPCDVLVRDQVQLVVHEAKPDFTIYAVGLSQRDLCHKQPKLADALNSVGVFNVTETSERYKARTILLSSAYVFNGSDRDFLESDTPDPNTMFGKTKSAAEFYIQKSCLNYIIFRCCNLYGRSINPRQMTFVEALERNLFTSKTVTIDGQVREGFLDVDYLGLVIKLSIDADIQNRLFQFSSPNQLSRYEFAVEYAKTFGLSESLVEKGTWHLQPLSGYPGSQEGLYYKMDSFNIESYLGVEIPKVEDSIRYSFQKHGGDSRKKSQAKTTGIRYI